MVEETGRLGSCVLNERLLIATARYVELNPVWAVIVKLPWEYQCSNTAFHKETWEVDPLVRDKTLRGLNKDWREILIQDESWAKKHTCNPTLCGNEDIDIEYVLRRLYGSRR